MNRLLPLAAGLLLLGVGCAEGPDDADGSVLEGSCDGDAIHCVDGNVIQRCEGGTWTDPEECPPERGGDPPVEVEVTTYCTDDGCRPGG